MAHSTELQVASDSGAGDCRVRKWVRTPWKAPRKDPGTTELPGSRTWGALIMQATLMGKEQCFPEITKLCQTSSMTLTRSTRVTWQQSHSQTKCRVLPALCLCSKAVRTPPHWKPHPPVQESCCQCASTRKGKRSKKSLEACKYLCICRISFIVGRTSCYVAQACLWFAT